jgi:cytochrome c-type biogenesis protein CcmF
VQQWGVTLAHAGLGVAIIGMTGIGVLASETRAVMTPGEHIDHAGYRIELAEIGQYNGPNYTAHRADLHISRDGASFARLTPGKRVYHASGTATSEASVVTPGLATLYSTIARTGESGDTKWIVHIRQQPLAPLLWLGFAMIIMGGIIATRTSLSRLQNTDTRTL